MTQAGPALMRRKAGRLSARRIKEGVEAYFSDEESVKSLPGLALALGIDTAELSRITVSEGAAGRLLSLAKTRIEKDVVENGLKGRYNASMSSFLLKTSFSYSEKTEPASQNVKVEVADELKRFAV